MREGNGQPVARRCQACRAARQGWPEGVGEQRKGVLLSDYRAKDGKRTRDDSNAEALKHAQLFLDGVHPGLYLFGGCGTGKSDLAAAVLNTLHVKPGGPTCLFISCTELLERLQGQFDDADADRRAEAQRLFDRVVRVGVLVLDDVGAQKASDYARRVLQDVFDRRVAAGLRTIWTSNWDLDTLSAEMDDRLASRIAGECMIVEMDGSDWRIRRAAKRTDGRTKRRRSAKD